jgi:hypothetical protein
MTLLQRDGFCKPVPYVSFVLSVVIGVRRSANVLVGFLKTDRRFREYPDRRSFNQVVFRQQMVLPHTFLLP